MAESKLQDLAQTKAELIEKLKHVKHEPQGEPSGRLRCPDCDSSVFHIQVPPPHTEFEDCFLYVISECGKLWRIRILSVKGRPSDPVQYLAKGKLEAMKP
jgi:hypothetical protein